MTKKLEGHTSTIWYIAYTLSKNVFHFGSITENQVCSTGQEELESFETEEAMAIRLGELTGDENYYQNYLDEQAALEEEPEIPEEEPGLEE